MFELDLGCTPINEDCVQVGSENYQKESRRECRAWKNQLLRVFGEHPNVQLSIKEQPHDYGSYLEVFGYAKEDDESAMDFLFGMEGELPEFWDAEAKKELGLKDRVIKCVGETVFYCTEQGLGTLDSALKYSTPCVAYRAIAGLPTDVLRKFKISVEDYEQEKQGLGSKHVD